MPSIFPQLPPIFLSSPESESFFLIPVAYASSFSEAVTMIRHDPEALLACCRFAADSFQGMGIFHYDWPHGLAICRWVRSMFFALQLHCLGQIAPSEVTNFKLKQAHIVHTDTEPKHQYPTLHAC